MSKPSVSILGCGWMGLPVAQQLISDGFTVLGSTTHPEKLNALEQSGIKPFLIRCTPQLEGENAGALFHATTLFLTLPFSRSLSDPIYYQKQIESVISYVERSTIKFVIFSSSTSVYPISTEMAREEDRIVADNDRSKVLYDVEQLLLNNPNFDATVVRFAGLYGQDRKLGRFLRRKREQYRNGDAPVNLIHLDDCIQIVKHIITGNIRKEIFNACSDVHPTRKALYTKKAGELSMDPPIFEGDDPASSKKIVSNEKLKRLTGYQFIHPDPMN